MKEKILDAAEIRARRSGYFGFSFRELAQDVGIKSASVHYHFPTKDQLAQLLARRYVERIAAHLGDPKDLKPKAALKRLAEIFIKANEVDDQMCLCGIFAAESSSLPQQVLPEVAAFFEMLTNWLDVALESVKGAPKAAEIVAALEGGLLMARVLKQPTLLQTILADNLKRISA